MAAFSTSLAGMKKHINSIWLVFVAICLSLFLLFPDVISKESVASYLSDLGPWAWATFIFLSLVRSAFLIPCTPFILAGAISFPNSPQLVILISLIGIAAGAYLIYSFPSFGSYDRLLEQKYPAKIASLKKKMQHKYALLFVAGWSFFPLVPTDAICYVAGVAKMRFSAMLAALLIGELPLVVIYVYAGSELGEWLRL